MSAAGPAPGVNGALAFSAVPVTVLLVDDEPDVRRLLHLALTLHGGFEVVGEARSGEAALDRAAALRPHVIVLDLGIPGLAGADLIGRIRQSSPGSQVVVFTGTDLSPELLGEVAGFLRKGIGIGRLVDLLGEVTSDLRHDKTLELPPDASSAGLARRFVRDTCERWGVEESVDELLLVVSELVTNALVHAGTGCSLRLTWRGDAVRVDVTDEGGGDPDPQLAATDDEHGRGLFLISAMSSAWGVEPADGGGKSIWAELLCEPVGS